MCDHNKENINALNWNVHHADVRLTITKRRKHEIKMHGGDHVEVNSISLGIVNNPFIAARFNFQRKTQVYIL